MRQALEHTRVDEVDERHHGVLHRQRDVDQRWRVGRRLHHLRRRPDVQTHDGAGLGAGREERIPVAAVNARQTEVVRDLAERHGPHTTIGIAPDLGGRGFGIPQWRDAQRDQPAGRITTPFFDHPVVVRVHQRQAEVSVVGRLFVERLPTEPRHRGERKRSLRVVEVHVGETGFGVVATGPHLVVGDTDVLTRGIVDRVVDAQHDRRAVHVLGLTEDPHVGNGCRGIVGELGHGAALAIGDRANMAPYDARRFVLVLRRQPTLEEVRRLDHVVVDADDPRDRDLGLLCHWSLLSLPLWIQDINVSDGRTCRAAGRFRQGSDRVHAEEFVRSHG